MVWGIKGKIYRALSAQILKASAWGYKKCRAKKEEHTPRIIALLQTLALGDTILTEPSIEVVKKTYPHAKLIIITTTYAKDLFLHNPYVDEIICYDKKVQSEIILYLSIHFGEKK